MDARRRARLGAFQASLHLVIPSLGWLIVQRDLTGSVQVRDASEVWATAVFSTPSRKIVGSNIAAAAHDSLAAAVHQAIHEPLASAPTHRPAVVLASPDLVDQVRDALAQEGLRVGVDEVAPPDWAEDVLTELTGHLAGRRQSSDPPAPEEWALLHQQATACAYARPWDRQGDDVHLRLELKIGSERTDAVAIVLGNSGVTRGLAVCPGREVPQAVIDGEEGVRPPTGTGLLTLIGRDEAPPEVLERAARYGWPSDLDAPLFLASGPDGPEELGQAQALRLTVALAAVVDHVRQGAGFGMDVRGELLLASGRRGRYRARLEPSVPLDMPPGLKVLSGEIRDDLLPAETVIGLGGLPWDELEWVRSRADLHLAAHLERSPNGDSLPILILGLAAEEGERVAQRLHAARPEGVALVEIGGEVVVVIITGTGMFGVADLRSSDPAVTRFRRRLAATDGWHGIVVGSSGGRREDRIYGFFECVLAQPPRPATAAQSARRRGQRRQQRRRTR
jgi:hypothetical protein